MSVFTGKDVVFKIGDSPLAITQLGSVDLEMSAELIDTTALGDAGRTNINGVTDHTLSLELHLDSSNASHAQLLVPGTSFAWEGYFEGETTGQLKLASTARIESVKPSAKVGDKVTASISCKQNNASGVTQSTVSA
jgi:hypothetical protein